MSAQGQKSNGHITTKEPYFSRCSAVYRDYILF